MMNLFEATLILMVLIVFGDSVKFD